MSGNLRAFLSELWDKVKRSWRSLSIMGILGAIALIVGLALDVPDFIERYFNNPQFLILPTPPMGKSMLEIVLPSPIKLLIQVILVSGASTHSNKLANFCPLPMMLALYLTKIWLLKN